MLDMGVAGCIFPGGVYWAMGKQGDPFMVPGIKKDVHIIVCWGNHVPQTLRNENGIQPCPQAGTFNLSSHQGEGGQSETGPGARHAKFWLGLAGQTKENH